MAAIASPAMAAGSDRQVLALQIVVGTTLYDCEDFRPT